MQTMVKIPDHSLALQMLNQKVDASMSDAIVLTNTDQVIFILLTGQISKEFSRNFAAMLAYMTLQNLKILLVSVFSSIF